MTTKRKRTTNDRHAAGEEPEHIAWDLELPEMAVKP